MSVNNLQWISAISCVALMLARGTGIHKAVVVPLLALSAPSGLISWAKFTRNKSVLVNKIAKDPSLQDFAVPSTVEQPLPHDDNIAN